MANRPETPSWLFAASHRLTGLIFDALSKLINFSIREMLVGLEEHHFDVLLAFGAAGVADLAEWAHTRIESRCTFAAKLEFRGNFPCKR
jgi:hypothetical protein